MLVHAAQRLGFHVAVFDMHADCPAGQAADRFFSAAGSESERQQSLLEMARLCDVITLEFENIDSALVREAARITRTHPSAGFLEICQDRIREKTSLAEAGFPTTPFTAVSSPTQAGLAGQEHGWPLVLKTATSGYDGKGQVIVKSAGQIQAAWEQLASDRVIAEKWIQYEAEVSMITARNLRGETISYPLFENTHADHILDVTRYPASSQLRELESQATAICRGIAETFDVIGLFCVEFFVTQEFELLINEIAPRPHNSGHLTIEAFVCSQFEQQLRSICNLPLAPPTALRQAAMANLLGEVWENGEPNWEVVLRHVDAHLHLYGKSQPRKGRKMGHITVLDDSSSEAAITSRELRDQLQVAE